MLRTETVERATFELLKTFTAIPMRTQQITYTSLERPASLTENNHVATFTYNAARERVKMQLQNGSSNVLTRYYLGGNYEIDEGTAGAKEKLYIGGDAYSAPVVYLKQNGVWGLHYICRDYLGNMTQITNSSGTVVQELSYDAWGRLRNPTNQTVYAPDTEPALLLGRGYTGHEHLPWFGLINMNARLYDPAVGRFLSPDPYVQSPLFSQNFNRYSYALNNPLVYSDPSGEKWWHWVFGGLALLDPVSAITTGLAISGSASASALTTAAVAAGTTTTIAGSSYVTTIANTPLLFFGGAIDKGWDRGRQLVSQSWKINNGLFYSDPNQNFWDRMQHLTSRFTWEGLQTIVGYDYTQIRNGVGNVDRVDYLGGATFATNENSNNHNRITFGNYINMNIPEEITGDFVTYATTLDPMFMHEYGHTIDSRAFGLSYLLAIGAFSGGSILFDRANHHSYWTETRANRRAENYFRRYYNVDWNFLRYPLD